MNKKIGFKSLVEYRNYVSEKYKIDLTKLYYVQKEDYNNFINSIVEFKIDYFLGNFINDSTEIRKSLYLEQNQSCIGRVLKEINTSLTGIIDSIKVENKIFKNYTFLNINNNEALNNLNSKKNKIVLIFSYKTGLITKKDFLEIQNLLTPTNNYELIIISIDDVAYL